MYHPVITNLSRTFTCACGYPCKDVALAVLGSFLVWVNSYNILLAINIKQSAECNCRILSGFHGVFSTLLCFVSAFILGPWPFSYVGFPPNQLHCAIIVVSLGYFLFDLLWCMYMQTEEYIMLVHHLLSLLGLSYVLWFNLYGCEITSILGASELTNPILQLRWFFKQSGKYTGTVEKLIDWSFFILFVCARIILGSALYIKLFLSPRLTTFAKVAGTGMHAVGVVFSIYIMLFIYRKYIKKRHKSM